MNESANLSFSADLAPPKLSEDSLRLVLELLNRRFGFQFHRSSQEMARTRIARHMEELGLADLRDYYYRLLYDPEGDAELDNLFELLVNNETYFFREESQIWTFADEILSQRLTARPESRIRVWCAGCSTGEEPYSLAIATLERQGPRANRVEIFGSDQSRKALDRGRMGNFSSFAFRSTPPELRKKYFEAESKNRWRIVPAVRRMVQFGRCNLLGSAGDLPLVKFDAIFCRNVLIYFDREARRQVINLFYERLAEGGYLFLGHSESLLDLSDRFEFAQLSQDVAYRRDAP
ncbi:MAG: CheR family methyltransferase [Acidobacteriota bacterium]